MQFENGNFLKKKYIIGIIPTIRDIRSDQFEISVDLRIFNFLNIIFPNSEINILNNIKKLKNENLLISVGGNTILSFSNKQKDIIRNKFDNFFFKQAKIKKIPYVGICHGAQFVAEKYKAIFQKDKNHVGKKHLINFEKKNYLVNSFHEFKIIKPNKHFDKIIKCCDESVEFFKIKNKNIYGVLWHPERNAKINKIDRKLFKAICS